ncbi:hypothetical protein G6L37_07525 [Agrobacterium rubi]|nr:hypothetical protein [Agrobacterium rubi]NTF25218.1 hypothetical protein [Agrobacterium rubi]
MKFKSLLAVAVLVSSASVAQSADSDRLKYLGDYDPLALRMLTCADLLAKDGRRIQGHDRNEIAALSEAYVKAGRAAVVRAALEAPGAPPAPRIENISFTSKTAFDAVTSDLRAHEVRAANLTEDVRASGFDVSSSCVDKTYVGEAAKLNEWFARDTSVLTKVK